MAWITPKTDWESTDFFNAADYNRIKGNLNVISDLAKVLYPNFAGIANMGNDKATNGTAMIYASELNLFTTNLHAVNNGTYGFNIPSVTTFVAGALTTGMLNYLNVIESYTLLIYNTLTAQSEGRYVLPFTLDGEKGVRV